MSNQRNNSISIIGNMVEDLRIEKNCIERRPEIRTAFNEAIDRLDVLFSKLSESEKSIKQLTKQQCINYWQADNITEEDTNYFVKRIIENGFFKDVPIDAQMTMNAWANCDATEANAYYLKAFAEIARAALGIE